MKSIIFADFTPTIVNCAPFTYTATQINGITPIDSTLFTFFPSSREIKVSSTNFAHIGIHTILITATLGTSGLYPTGSL